MSLLSQALLEGVSKLYPEVRLTRFARFLPMNDLESGEFSSTAAVEVARVLKQGAGEIADRLIVELAKSVSATWRHDNGYIVCSALSMPALLAEGASSAQAALKLLGSEDEGSGAFLRGVLCLIPDGTEPVYARIRLVARSVVQALLAVEFQGPITVCLNPLDPVRVGTKRELIELFQRAVDYIFKHQGEARVEVPLPRGAIWDGSGVVSIWSSHHYHERLSKATRADLSNGRKGGAWQLTMPPDAWLLCRDRALLEILEAPYLGRVIERLESDDDWLIFLCHCASTMPSGDFDPAVALFEECSSPLWSLRVLIERFGRFAPSVPLPTPLASLARCSTDPLGADRELFIRSLAMPFYAARAIALSDLEGWCGAIERLAKGGHAFINSPSIRLALEKGGLDGRQSEIATSLGFGLSCIMNIVMEN